MKDNVILITGSSTGFGRLSAESLAQEGHTVYASMRDITGRNKNNAEELNKWAKNNNAQLKTIELDVTNENSIQNAVDSIIHNEGRLDVLINNAGGGGMGVSEDYTIDELRKQYEVNVFGLFATTKAVIPQMRKQQQGLIISISSGFGRTVMPLFEVYCSSKFAMEALAEGWRYELSHFGIDSVIVEPGAFPTTDFGKNMQAFSPQTKNSIPEYGPLAGVPDGFMTMLQESVKNGQANDPQLVVKAISGLIDMPADQRPLRTVVDPFMETALNPLNEMTDKIQTGILGWMQLQDLQRVRTTVKS
jgi:NAD(P)-dependent dehydrogenase (short-subunit alcohol dehydrogenase family)